MRGFVNLFSQLNVKPSLKQHAASVLNSNPVQVIKNFSSKRSFSSKTSKFWDDISPFSVSNIYPASAMNRKVPPLVYDPRSSLAVSVQELQRWHNILEKKKWNLKVKKVAKVELPAVQQQKVGNLEPIFERTQLIDIPHSLPSYNPEAITPMLAIKRTWQPKKGKRRKKHGFLVRIRTVGGRRVINRRKLKKRKFYSV